MTSSSPDTHLVTSSATNSQQSNDKKITPTQLPVGQSEQLQKLLKAANSPKYAPISKYPKIPAKSTQNTSIRQS